MCGIICYRGKDSASSKIFDGLEKLEYRGYDSAGIATASKGSLNIVKERGTIAEIIEDHGKLPGNVGIGHTRWATHGEVNKANAHPHTGPEGKVAVVHNGIIENHAQLREELGEENFTSDTDTEVIPHLIEREMEKTEDLKQICENVMEKLEGSFAAVALLETGELFAMKNESPLVIGDAGDEIFLSSDVTPFLEHTSEAVFLEDSDYAVIGEEGYEIFNDEEEVSREVKEIEWEAEEASKKGYDHFMQKEIFEQSKSVKRAAFQDRKDLEKAVELMENADRIYLTGCGTSSFAASLGARYLRKAGFTAFTEQAHELEYRREEITEDDLVIGLSQSGETADLLSFLEGVEADLLSIINVVDSTLDRNSDHSLYVNAGPEIGVASTKAFTGQLTVLKLLEYASEGKIEEGRKSLIDTAEKVETVIEDNEEKVDQLSEYLQDKEDIYFIGRNHGYDIAREAALKLKELSYIHAESFPGGEFKHGTLALVEEGVPVVGFLKEDSYEETMSNIEEAKSRGADAIGVGNRNPGEGFMEFIDIPEDENSEILEVIPFQLLAYRTAKKMEEANPDRPRNLAKSVTVK